VALRRYRRLVARMAQTRILAAFKAAHPAAALVQIGANDGHSHDPLHPIPSGWTGVLVEPVPAVFARLRDTVGERPGLRLVNAAVAERAGRVPFYSDPADDTLGSLDPAQLADPVVTEVDAVTWAELAVERADLLVIDTEGHDWEILRHAPLERLRPRLIVFEHYHLPAGDRDAARDHLRELGYDLIEEGLDTLALDVAPSDALTERWRTLKPALPAMSRH
jgi:FkbM family methyltransferase